LHKKIFEVQIFEKWPKIGQKWPKNGLKLAKIMIFHDFGPKKSVFQKFYQISLKNGKILKKIFLIQKWSKMAQKSIFKQKNKKNDIFQILVIFHLQNSWNVDFF